MSIGGNADEKLRLLVIVSKGDARNIIVHICDFRRGVLNICSVARIQHLLPGQIWTIIFLESWVLVEGKFRIYMKVSKPLPKSSNPLKGLNNLLFLRKTEHKIAFIIAMAT